MEVYIKNIEKDIKNLDDIKSNEIYMVSEYDVDTGNTIFHGICNKKDKLIDMIKELDFDLDVDIININKVYNIF